MSFVFIYDVMIGTYKICYFPIGKKWVNPFSFYVFRFSLKWNLIKYEMILLAIEWMMMKSSMH